MKNLTFEFYMRPFSINDFDQILVYLDDEIIEILQTFDSDLLNQLHQIPFKYVSDNDDFMLNIVQKYPFISKQEVH